MHEVSGSLNPYNYKSTNQGYQFITADCSIYLLYFTEASDYFPSYIDINAFIVSHGFEKIRDSSLETDLPKADPRIRDTIFSILNAALENDPRFCFMSICSTSDGKHRFRNKLFATWYAEIGNMFELNFNKIDNRICGNDGDCAYLSILIHKQCPHGQKVRDAFLDLENELIRKGY
jgi:hypothetical protein